MPATVPLQTANVRSDVASLWMLRSTRITSNLVGIDFRIGVKGNDLANYRPFIPWNGYIFGMILCHVDQ